MLSFVLFGSCRFLSSQYYGNSHTFTNTFAGGMHRDFGLNTALTKSKVNVKEEFGYY